MAVKLSSHLVHGQCEAAFQVYERCLGGEIVTMLIWDESPAAKQAPAAWAGKIIHATLAIGDQLLSGVDSPGARRRQAGFLHSAHTRHADGG